MSDKHSAKAYPVEKWLAFLNSFISSEATCGNPNWRLERHVLTGVPIPLSFPLNKIEGVCKPFKLALNPVERFDGFFDSFLEFLTFCRFRLLSIHVKNLVCRC
jgi:hypothetical protein